MAHHARTCLLAASMVLFDLTAGALVARADAVAPQDFEAGTWSLATHAGWIGDDDHQLASVHVAAALHPVDNFAVSLGLSGYGIWIEDDTRAPAGGFDFLMRWYAVRADWVAFFVEAGCGAMVSGMDFPRETSWWNFTPQARVGLAFEIAPRTHVTVMGGWWHASTAQIEQPNPGFNGAQLAMGVLIQP